MEGKNETKAKMNENYENVYLNQQSCQEIQYISEGQPISTNVGALQQEKMKIFSSPSKYREINWDLF